MTRPQADRLTRSLRRRRPQWASSCWMTTGRDGGPLQGLLSRPSAFSHHTADSGRPRRRLGVKQKSRSEPVSRVLSRAAISLGRRLPAASSNLPGSDGGPNRPAPETVSGSFLLGLAPSGVCPATAVTRSAVRSYRTISPLPHHCRSTCVERGTGAAVYFLWHFPDPCGRWALPTTVSCGARTFLSQDTEGFRLPRPASGRSVRSGRH